MDELGYIAEGLRGLAVPIGEVHEDGANARTGHAVERIAGSLKQYGQRKPIVANRLEGGKVVAGNGTLRAARWLGWGYVAVALQRYADAFGIVGELVDGDGPGG